MLKSIHTPPHMPVKPDVLRLPFSHGSKCLTWNRKKAFQIISSAENKEKTLLDNRFHRQLHDMSSSHTKYFWNIGMPWCCSAQVSLNSLNLYYPIQQEHWNPGTWFYRQYFDWNLKWSLWYFNKRKRNWARYRMSEYFANSFFFVSSSLLSSNEIMALVVYNFNTHLYTSSYWYLIEMNERRLFIRLDCVLLN